MADDGSAPRFTEEQTKILYAVGGLSYTAVVVTLMVLAPAIGESPIDIECSNVFTGGGGAQVGVGIFLGLLGSIMINTGAFPCRAKPKPMHFTPSRFDSRGPCRQQLPGQGAE